MEFDKFCNPANAPSTKLFKSSQRQQLKSSQQSIAMVVAAPVLAPETQANKTSSVVSPVATASRVVPDTLPSSAAKSVKLQQKTTDQPEFVMPTATASATAGKF